MPRFEPFAGVRYDRDQIDLAEVTAPPYDVIDAAERAALAARHPNNAVLVDCPGDEGPSCYERAASRFVTWREQGILRTDQAPSLTIYRMTYAGEDAAPRHTTGVIGALGLERPGPGAGVLPHEHTTPKAKSDRLDLLRATRANLSPVWGLGLAEGLTKLLEPTGAPWAAWQARDGVSHEVWRVDDAGAIDAITEAVGATPVVIADGHHRYETCLTYLDECRASGIPVGGADATMVWVVELADDELAVRAIHRLVADLPADFDPMPVLERSFEVVDAGPPDGTLPARMRDEDALALVVPGAAWFLRPRPGLLADGPDLDTSRLDVALADFPPHTLSFQHGAGNVQAAVESGRAQIGVLLRPVSVPQIAAVAHAGERMPPKSTFFWPKPVTGVVFRPFD